MKWTLLAAVEVGLAVLVVVGDVLQPTLVLLVLASASLAVRREGPASLGFERPPDWARVVTTVAGITRRPPSVATCSLVGPIHGLW